jgi:ABC-type transport system involved in multi-copper enzyme maturation permease subunit
MTALKLWDNLLRRFPALKVYAANPVVMRDLRAQMRGARSYWYIGGYLILLGLLAVAGYAQATGQSLNPAQWDNNTGRNIVDAQSNLEAFYIFIFGTLALMVTLIAPALTAASVVGERQRQSFDLLVTTPLSSGQLLIGKLVSSIAFLGLLLLLSLPASALCILLGGATPADVLRVYFLLAVDGIVLSAIGLYFSCAVRVPLLATVWTYVAVAAFFFVTGAAGMLTAGSQMTFALTPAVSIMWLNPLMTIAPAATGNTPQLLLHLAIFLGIATLILRLLLAAATYRLGLFGAQSGVSLRRQSLVLAGILTAFLSHGMTKLMFEGEARTFLSMKPSYGSLMLAVLMVVLPFLPSLFVPHSPDEAPPGRTTETAPNPEHQGIFDVRRLFRPEHSGALPWYVAFVLTVMVASVAGALPYGVQGISLLLTGGFYLLGIGLVAWSLSRLAGSLVEELSGARATAFAFYICVFGLPTLIFSLQRGEWWNHPLIPLWLLSPVLYNHNPGWMAEAMIRSGGVAVALSIFIALLASRIQGREMYGARIPAAR